MKFCKRSGRFGWCPFLAPRFLRRRFGNTTDIPGGSEDGGLEEFLKFIPKNRSSSSMRFCNIVIRYFNAAFSSSNCFIYASLSVKLLSNKDKCLLKSTSITRNWVNAYEYSYQGFPYTVCRTTPYVKNVSSPDFTI